MPVINQVYEHQRQVYEKYRGSRFRCGTGFSRYLPILRNVINPKARNWSDLMRKVLFWLTIDQSWQEHLANWMTWRRAFGMRKYEQKDPLLIYKFEAFELFTAMIDKVNRDVVSTLMKAHIPHARSKQCSEGSGPQEGWISANSRAIQG